MKKTVIASVLVLMVAGIALANPEGVCSDGKLIGHLKIIGVAKDKNANMDQAAGNVIFVGLGSQGQADRTKIYLFEAPEGEDFAVLDKNGTDGSAAFQLPDPDLDPYLIGDPGEADTISAYSVFVRPLGKPGGWATITTCADLVDSTFAGLLPGTLVNVLNRQEDGAYCSIEQVGAEITLRKTGKSIFTNVTAQLLTIVFQVVVDTNPDPLVEDLETVCVRVPIFDDILENEYWEYDNYGLKNLDVRFYNCPTDVSAGDGALTGC